MKGHYLFLLSLLIMAGCDSAHPYKKKAGTWYYDDVPIGVNDADEFTPLNDRFGKSKDHGYYRYEVIGQSDGKTFEAVSDHYAKDKINVFFCDTYRDGKDYFTTKRTLITLIKGADAASFRYIEANYARDTTNMFYEDKLFKVHDINSFQVLDDGFAKDKVSGYYQQVIIPGSIGKSFTAINNHFAKDQSHVFYCAAETTEANTLPVAKNLMVPNAQPGSFQVFEYDYAKDTGRLYYRTRMLTDDTEGFTVLQYGYAKTNRRVYYMGDAIPEIDANTFVTLDSITETADAKDNMNEYLQGKKQ
jgi:hypothetical protein